MVHIARVRVPWSGNTIDGPAISTFYYDVGDSVDANIADERASLVVAFGHLANVTALGTSTSVPFSGDVLEDTTGQLVGTWRVVSSDPGIATSGVTGQFARGVGGRMRFRTNGITNGRRVLGSTYVVPLAGSQYDAGGRMTINCHDRLQLAANAITSVATLRIWSRPNHSGRAGKAVNVTSSDVPLSVSWLRSRRT